MRKSLYPNRWHEGEEHTVVQTAFRVVVELMHTARSTAVEAVEEDRYANVARQMALALLTAHGIVECLAQKVVVIAVHRLLRLRESCHLLRELNGMLTLEIVEILQHLTCGDVVAEELHSRTWIVGLLRGIACLVADGEILGSLLALNVVLNADALRHKVEEMCCECLTATALAHHGCLERERVLTAVHVVEADVCAIHAPDWQHSHIHLRAEMLGVVCENHLLHG